MKNLNVVFMGTPDFACPILQTLIENTNVSLVVSQPDKLVGRKRVLTYPPIKKLAMDNNIEVFQPIKIKEDYQKIIDKKPDIIITCAYGQIVPASLLDVPSLGCVNVHASLLPRLRGGAPIHKALIDGYEKTGITIMYMDEKMDSGDIIAQEEYIIKKDDNVEILHNELSKIGASLLIKTLPSIIDGTNDRIKQKEEEVTYAFNIKREEEHIDFNKTVEEIYNQVRGLNSWPLANTIINDKELKVLKCSYKKQNIDCEPGTIVELSKTAFGITAKDGVIYLEKVKPFGKNVMDIKDYLNGINIKELLNQKVK